MMATIHIPNGLHIKGEKRWRKRGFSLETGTIDEGHVAEHEPDPSVASVAEQSFVESFT